MLFGSRIDLGLVSTKSRVIITFWTIGPPLFSSSGNQSFRYTVRFTSTLSFECYCVHPISPMPYRSPVLQPFRAIAFAYFSFGVRSVEFVSWSRSCCWLENVRVQFMCFFHHFNQFVGTAAIFSHFRTVLSSNSESVHKTTRTFAYGLWFQRSIYQNRSEKILDLSVPTIGGFENFIISKFASEDWVFSSWSFFHIFRNLQKIPEATSFTCLSSNFLWLPL